MKKYLYGIVCFPMIIGLLPMLLGVNKIEESPRTKSVRKKTEKVEQEYQLYRNKIAVSNSKIDLTIYEIKNDE